MKVMIPSSAGDLVDRITILEVKLQNIKQEAKRATIELHLLELSKIHAKLPRSAKLAKLKKELLAVNKRQWKLEDTARLHWKNKNFIGAAKAAHAVHVSNDKRVHIKRKIDEHVGSKFVDEKQYVK